MHAVEEGHHDRLQEDHPDQTGPAAILVDDVDQVDGSVAGKDNAGEEEGDADDGGDVGLLGLELDRGGLDDEGGDCFDHAHGGVQPESPEHEEEQGAPKLRQRQGAHLSAERNMEV